MSGSSSVGLIHGTVLALALGFLPGPAGAADPVADGAAVPSDPVFTVHLIEGKTLSGQLRQLGPSDRLTLVSAQGPDRVVPLDQVVKVTRDGPPAVYAPEVPVVLLPDGDRLFRAVVGVTKDMSIEVQQYILGNLNIPLDSLAGLVFGLPAGESEDADLILDRMRRDPRTTEVLWLSNGDRLVGNFLGLDETKVRFQTENGTLSLEQSGVSGLAFDPALISYPRPAGTFLELTLSDGSRLGVQHVRIDQGQIAATTRFGAEVRIPLNELLAAHPRSDRLVYLAERPVAREQSIPYVGPSRPFQRDRTVDGHLFRLGGQTYDRGLGTASRSFLAYRLDPGDQRFQAQVGLDDRAGALGNLVFRVLVDGKERYASPPMSVRDTPRAVDVDVAGGSVLILVTDFGDRGGVRDFADWAEARLVRSGTPQRPSAH
ncbi:MAG: NPCBM/NEW2 domain-containing protein [Isosphaeraceae bacterium]|nr:NPCBM/NEW2 domain-containing protein [Isosphaeraceae bacterium]